jgi:glycosyltransferase involved in cell wall biosynthesis
LFLDLPIQRLKFVTAVSNATKKEIIDSTGCDPDKVRVIYNPLQETLSNGEPKAFNKDFPTILQIGITENKNISRLIDALEGIPCKLVLVGHLPGSLQAKLRSSGVDYQIVHDLDDEQMKRAYEEADIVSFCSTYEGFGLPIIEAQGMCTPLLTSDLPPMNEVAGEGAWFVDPFDVSSIRSGLMAIINNDSLRSEIVEKGIENVRRFDPSLIAGQYLELYDEITY